MTLKSHLKTSLDVLFNKKMFNDDENILFI